MPWIPQASLVQTAPSQYTMDILVDNIPNFF
jgi:hypothetical protein